MNPPQNLVDYVAKKTTNGKSGGRPHFLQQLAKTYPSVIEELLNILDAHWLKDRKLRNLARKYKTGYHTLMRLVQDLEPFKESIVKFLKETPRRKQFYNKELNQSDYPTVTQYINRSKREERTSYVRKIKSAKECWKALNYKDPATWNADEVTAYLHTLPEGTQFGHLVSIRQVAPQIKEQESPDYVSTIRYKAKIKKRKKGIFGEELQLILVALDYYGLKGEKVIFKFHLTTGCREGTRNKSGICGITWDKFKKNFHAVDIYESKSKITWTDCPVDLFFYDLPQELRALWKERGKPITAKLIEGGYTQLIKIYQRIKKAVKDYYAGKLEPSLFKDLTDLKPHDSDKIHCNLLWESETPLEVVCGEVLGHGEGLGLVGRGWKDVNIIKDYYLSLTRRSKRFKKLRRNITEYSAQFNPQKEEVCVIA